MPAADRRAATVTGLRATRAAVHAVRGRRPAIRRKITPQVPPKAIARSYLAALLVIVRAARAAAQHHLGDHAATLAKKAASGESVHDQIASMVDAAAAQHAREWPASRIGGVVAQFGQRTSNYQRAELVRQLKGPLGVEVSIPDRRAPSLLSAFAVEGRSKVQRLVALYFEQVRAVAMKRLRPKHLDAPPDGSVGPGEDPGETYDLEAQAMTDGFILDLGTCGDVAEGYAAQTADRSIRGLFGDLNAARQQELGLDEYTWETMEDDRVRPEHARLHGRRFSWDNPPAIGNPGEPPNCRCLATPVVKDVQQELQ